MHQSIERFGLSEFIKREAPTLVVAFIIAELFYKWKSFTLECLGFLATWYALSFLYSWAAKRL